MKELVVTEEEAKAIVFIAIKIIMLSSPEVKEFDHDAVITIEQISSFIEQSPPLTSVPSSFEVEVGLRILSLLMSIMNPGLEVTEAQFDVAAADHNLRPVVREWIRRCIIQTFKALQDVAQSSIPPIKLLGSEGILLRRLGVSSYEELHKILSGEYAELVWAQMQFTTPTALLPLIQTFGASKLPQAKEQDAGRITVKRFIFIPEEIRDPSREVGISLPFLEHDAGLEPLERQLRKLCDPLALKVLLGVLYFCHHNHRNNWFIYDVNAMCDLLGYARDSRGYHQSMNKQRIEDRMKTFLKALYRCEWTGGLKQRIPLEMSLLLLDPNSRINWMVDDVTLRKGQIIYFCGPLYDDIAKNRLYSWLDTRFLQLDAKEHGRVVQLGTYYSAAWRIDWRNSKGRLRRELRTILSDIGTLPGIEHRNIHRTVKGIRQDHDFMAEKGFIKEWSIARHAADPLDEVWEIVIPDTHGLIMASKKSHPTG